MSVNPPGNPRARRRVERLSRTEFWTPESEPIDARRNGHLFSGHQKSPSMLKEMKIIEKAGLPFLGNCALDYAPT
jgi:hypothetical protein